MVAKERFFKMHITKLTLLGLLLFVLRPVGHLKAQETIANPLLGMVVSKLLS